jgi:small subunit ribosomal protein S3
MKGEVYGRRDLSPLVGQQKKAPAGGRGDRNDRNDRNDRGDRRPRDRK